jgi:hypothetical protein
MTAASANTPSLKLMTRAANSRPKEKTGGPRKVSVGGFVLEKMMGNGAIRLLPHKAVSPVDPSMRDDDTKRISESVS